MRACQAPNGSGIQRISRRGIPAVAAETTPTTRSLRPGVTCPGWAPPAPLRRLPGAGYRKEAGPRAIPPRGVRPSTLRVNRGCRRWTALIRRIRHVDPLAARAAAAT